jgi:hypothetical protein
MKVGEFLAQLRNYQLLNKDCLDVVKIRSAATLLTNSDQVT